MASLSLSNIPIYRSYFPSNLTHWQCLHDSFSLFYFILFCNIFMLLQKKYMEKLCSFGIIEKDTFLYAFWSFKNYNSNGNNMFVSPFIDCSYMFIYCINEAPCSIWVSRIEPLWNRACRKSWLMEASRGLPAGIIPLVVKFQEPPIAAYEVTRPSRNLERSSSSLSSPLSTVFFMNYFQKTTCFILTVYGDI